MANPRLRFRRADGSEYPDWKATTLKQLGRTKSGTGFPDRYQGCKDLPIPFYKVSDMTLPGNETTMNTANNYVSAEILTELKANPINADAIIFAKVGAALLLERKRIAQPPFVIDNNMMAYIPQNAQFLPPFAYQWFLSQRVSQLAQKGALPSINGNDVNDIKISIPSLEEQAKIAAFLSAVDDVIAATSKEVADLELMKRGAMQRIFSQEIRFRRDDGSDYPKWQSLEMNQIFTEIIDKSHPDLPVLSILQGEGTVLRDQSDRRIQYNRKSLSGYKAMKPGDFIIHLRSFEGGLECANQEGISSPAYKILRSTTINTDIYRYYLRSHDFIRNKLSVAVVGIRDGKNIDMDTFWHIAIPVPCLEEQAKIAEFLAAMDTAIAKAKAELDLWRLLKRGLTQQMFA